MQEYNVQSQTSQGSSFAQGFQKQTQQVQAPSYSATSPQVTVTAPPQRPVPTQPPQPRSYSLSGSSAPRAFKPAPSPLAKTTPAVGQSASRPNVSQPNAGGASGGASGRQSGAIGVAPKRGRGILNLASGPGCRVPLCGHCNSHIRYSIECGNCCAVAYKSLPLELDCVCWLIIINIFVCVYEL